jgi:hypothetical protein
MGSARRAAARGGRWRRRRGARAGRPESRPRTRGAAYSAEPESAARRRYHALAALFTCAASTSTAIRSRSRSRSAQRSASAYTDARRASTGLRLGRLFPAFNDLSLTRKEALGVPFLAGSEVQGNRILSAAALPHAFGRPLARHLSPAACGFVRQIFGCCKGPLLCLSVASRRRAAPNPTE